VDREKVALKVVSSKGVRRLKGRFIRSVGVNLQVHMGERHLPRLLSRCHGLRWPDKRFIGRRLLRAGYLPGWDHVIQQDLLQWRRMQASQEDWRAGFASVIEGETNQTNWREIVVEDPV
jgi:hypothetical protein